MIKKILNGKIYSFNFGIKQLIYPKNFLSLEEVKIKQYIFQNILIQKQEADKIYNMLSDSEIEQIIIETFESSFFKNPLSNNHSPFNSLLEYLSDSKLSNEIDQLYKKAVGEMQISSTSFWDMTPKEIQLAYLGYVTHMELVTNCILAAAKKSQTSDDSLISLLQNQEYRLADLKEREKTFKILNIK